MIIEPTLPEHGLARARSLTSRSRAPNHFPFPSRGLSRRQGGTDLRTNPATMNSGSSPIGMVLRPLAAEDGADASAPRNPRQALAAERIRIRHMCKALAHAEEGNLRRRWQTEMADSLARVRVIERMLRPGTSPAEQRAADMVDGCLLEAMELARDDGGSRTAETVAMECMALVEMRCMRIQKGSVRREAAFVPERTRPLQGAAP